MPGRSTGTGLQPGGAGPRTVIIGVISAPGTSTELAERLRPDLTERIGARPGVRWGSVRLDRLVDGPADLSQLISAARRRLIDEQWHLTVCVTDLPLQTARRPVVAHASMTHGVAVLSLPALGAVGVTRRAADALVRLVAALVGDADRANLDAHPRPAPVVGPTPACSVAAARSPGGSRNSAMR